MTVCLDPLTWSELRPIAIGWMPTLYSNNPFRIAVIK